MFRILWGFDALITLVVLCVLLVGLSDGLVGASNAGLWFVMIAVLAAVMGGSLWLRANNQMVLAKVLLWILAVPGLLYGCFLLVVIIGKPRWN